MSAERLCPRNGKYMHASPGQARKSLLSVKRHKNDGMEREIYKCTHCGFYHFGASGSTKKWKQERQRLLEKARMLDGDE